MEGKVSEEEKEINGVRAEQVVLDWQARAKRKQQIHLLRSVFLSLNCTITDQRSQGSSAGFGPCSISGVKHKHLALLTAHVQINLILHDNWVIW